MTEPLARWWSAVGRGARGDYAGSWAELDAVAHGIGADRRRSTDPRGLALVSLTLSTRGSHLRQIGDIDGARGLDETAVGLAREAAAMADLPIVRAAEADARIGLAADAIASGCPADAALASVASLALVASLTAPSAPPGLEGGHDSGLGVGPVRRIGIRWHWVSAEDRMLAGASVAAREHAAAAVGLAGESAPRHRAKGLVIAAACTADPAEAAALLVRADGLIRAGGWDTLAWPLALVADRVTGPAAVLDRCPGGTVGLQRRGARAARRIGEGLPAALAPLWWRRPDVRGLLHAAGE